MTKFSPLFLLSFPFFFSYLSLVSWSCGASGSSFSCGCVFKNGVRFHFLSWTIWRSLSAAGLNVIAISQDGRRCNPTRTAPVLLWPRTAENAGAATFVLFISTRSTTSRSDQPILPEATVSFDAREGPLSSREGCCRCLGSLRMPLQGRFALGGLLNKWRRGLAGGGVKVNVWPTFEGSVHDGWIRER